MKADEDNNLRAFLLPQIEHLETIAEEYYSSSAFNQKDR